MVLKAIAYEDRRAKGVIHDLEDLEFVLRNYSALVGEARLFQEAGEVLITDQILYVDAPAYCLGREIGATYAETVTGALERIAKRLGSPDAEETRGLDRRSGASGGLAGANETAARWRALELGILQGRRPA